MNEPADLNYTPHILVIRLSSLGDIILTSPVYRNIKEKWPNSEISVLVKPQFAAALTGNPHVDRVIPFQGIWHTLGIIRQRNITHLLDLHATLRTFIIGALANIPYRSRYRKDSLARRMFVKFGIPSPKLQRHVLDRYLDALKAWDIPIKHRDVRLTDWNYYKKNEDKPKKAARICIFQTAFLGDTVLTGPLIKKTAELFPKSEITIVTRPETVDIFKPMREISLIIVDDKKSAGLIAGIRKMSKTLAERKFDVIIVPHRSFRSALIAYLSGTPVRVGFSSSAGKFLYNRVVPFSWLLHDTERNLSLLSAIAPADIAPAALTFQENEQNRAEINSRLERLGCYSNRPLIGIHPGSVWFTKRWPPHKFAALIRMLYKALNARAVLVGGKGDYELAEEVCRLSRTDAINWTGKTTLPELMALMTNFKLFVTNDSGPMHIATAFNVPTIGIFGPTTKELGFFPYGAGNRVIEKDLPCRPCALHGGKVCPRGHFLCMQLITAREVFSNSYEMLTGKVFDWNAVDNPPPPAEETARTAAAPTPAAPPAVKHAEVRQQKLPAKPAPAASVSPAPKKEIPAQAQPKAAPQPVKYSPEPEYAPAPQRTERKTAGPKYFDAPDAAPKLTPPIDADSKKTVGLEPVKKPNRIIFGDNPDPIKKPLQLAEEPAVEESELKKWESSLAAPTSEPEPQVVAWQNPEAINPATEPEPQTEQSGRGVFDMFKSAPLPKPQEAEPPMPDYLSKETRLTEDVIKKGGLPRIKEDDAEPVKLVAEEHDYDDGSGLPLKRTLSTEEVLKNSGFSAMKETRWSPKNKSDEADKPREGLRVKRPGLFGMVSNTLKAAGVLKDNRMKNMHETNYKNGKDRKDTE